MGPVVDSRIKSPESQRFRLNLKSAHLSDVMFDLSLVRIQVDIQNHA